MALYRNSPHPKHVVLFVSGDGGWKLGVVGMARALASLDSLVAGIDIIHYLKQLEASGEPCSYPVSDFEALGQFLQKKLNFPDYTHPILVGYSSGATLVYSTLVQSPPGTFQAALSMGFCPDLPLAAKPMCRGYGLEWGPGLKGKGYSFPPAKTLEDPWVCFQGDIDQVCHPEAVRNFVKEVPNGRIVLLPKVGHGFSVEKNWMPRFKKTDLDLAAEKSAPQALPAFLSDLPLIEAPAKYPTTRILSVIVTGDGGWTGLDRGIASVLAGEGISVVGLNSMKYFWQKRTPEETGKDLKQIIDYYTTVWKAPKVLLIGFSTGADVVPFMVNRVPKDTQSRISMVCLLAPGLEEDFEFHIMELFGKESKGLPVTPEIENLPVPKVLCFYGSEDKEISCRQVNRPNVRNIETEGGHHFGRDYKKLARIILENLEGPEAAEK